MADYADAALPVYTPGDGEQKLQTKIVDPTGVNTVNVDSAGNLSTNVNVNDVTPDTGNGTTGATSTLRVTLSSDSTGQVKLAAGSNTIGSLAANQSVNVTEVGGSALALGQTTMADSVPVVIASDQSPISVSIVSATGTNVNNYSTTAAVAVNATATNTYSVTSGKTLSLGKVWASGTGKMKIKVQTGPSGSLVTQFVGFTSVANPNLSIDLGQYPIPVPSTSSGEVVLTITNEDTAAFDIHSTITGTEQ